MDPAAIVVRPPQPTMRWRRSFAYRAQFIRGAPLDVAAADLRRYVYDARRLTLAAYEESFTRQSLPGRISDRRALVTDSAQRGCALALVSSSPTPHRGQGIGKALMRDSFDYARARGQHPPHVARCGCFTYQPFGYADVFDATEHDVRRADVLAHPTGPYLVRLATVKDAAAVRSLYDRHLDHTPEALPTRSSRKRFCCAFPPLSIHMPTNSGTDFPLLPPVIAIDTDGRPRGYLSAPWALCGFLVVRSPPTTGKRHLALLQYHARLLDELDEPQSRCAGHCRRPTRSRPKYWPDHFTVQSASPQPPFGQLGSQPRRSRRADQRHGSRWQSAGRHRSRGRTIWPCHRRRPHQVLSSPP